MTSTPSSASDRLLLHHQMPPAHPATAAIDHQTNIVHDWKGAEYDPNDTRPFIRKPTGQLFTPCGFGGPKFSAPYPWLWMFPAILFPVTGFCIAVPPAQEVWSRVVACLLAATAFAVMFLSNMVDPGIVLPARVGDPPAQPITIHIDGVGDVELEVCRTCKILRPPRSSHCGTADVCCRDYDHFCGVINSVVGQKTFRWFTHFMWTTLCLILFVGARSIYAVSDEFDYTEMASSHWGRFRLVCTFCIMFFLLFATCWTGGAFWIYFYYAGTDLTLKDLKGRKTFKNTKTAHWTCTAFWVRLFSCDHYPASVLNDSMTWIETEENGKVRLVGVNGVIDENYKMPQTQQLEGPHVVTI